ncbi:ABC transporter substrate-binding protein [Acetobacter farinalis]|uniref:ABC transporter substrate-binding protein n=1 Tax=Acetobacter farinalis TaxID=1260984 RepID=A0ABT3Q997_9PROT|nr:ABC transporter substrate-binding protein [Acetobacter farinalis]MCX2561861.1 ABC transporter substrate-binding protein [Acetobacter farinalis]NHO30352.1 ABC transporter substrate-binding protein [Acetobacter farinalis]
MQNYFFRRKLFSVFLTLACLAAAVPVCAAGSAQSAQTFVQMLGRQWIDIMNGTTSLSEKKTQMRPFLDRAVDVDDVARYCLGTYWRIATPGQRLRYLGLFHAIFTNSITERLGDYSRITFTIGRASAFGEDMAVETVITRPNQPGAKVLWIVKQANGDPKVVDMIAEGVSLRLTERQDYVSFIERNNGNIDILLQTLARQLARHG